MGQFVSSEKNGRKVNAILGKMPAILDMLNQVIPLSQKELDNMETGGLLYQDGNNIKYMPFKPKKRLMKRGRMSYPADKAYQAFASTHPGKTIVGLNHTHPFYDFQLSLQDLFSADYSRGAYRSMFMNTILHFREKRGLITFTIGKGPGMKLYSLEYKVIGNSVVFTKYKVENVTRLVFFHDVIQGKPDPFVKRYQELLKKIAEKHYVKSRSYLTDLRIDFTQTKTQVFLAIASIKYVKEHTNQGSAQSKKNFQNELAKIFSTLHTSLSNTNYTPKRGFYELDKRSSSKTRTLKRKIKKEIQKKILENDIDRAIYNKTFLKKLEDSLDKMFPKPKKPNSSDMKGLLKKTGSLTGKELLKTAFASKGLVPEVGDVHIPGMGKDASLGAVTDNKAPSKGSKNASINHFPDGQGETVARGGLGQSGDGSSFQFDDPNKSDTGPDSRGFAFPDDMFGADTPSGRASSGGTRTYSPASTTTNGQTGGAATNDTSVDSKPDGKDKTPTSKPTGRSWGFDYDPKLDDESDPDPRVNTWVNPSDPSYGVTTLDGVQWASKGKFAKRSSQKDSTTQGSGEQKPSNESKKPPATTQSEDGGLKAPPPDELPDKTKRPKYRDSDEMDNSSGGDGDRDMMPGGFGPNSPTVLGPNEDLNFAEIFKIFFGSMEDEQEDVLEHPSDEGVSVGRKVNPEYQDDDSQAWVLSKDEQGTAWSRFLTKQGEVKYTNAAPQEEIEFAPSASDRLAPYVRPVVDDGTGDDGTLEDGFRVQSGLKPVYMNPDALPKKDIAFDPRVPDEAFQRTSVLGHAHSSAKVGAARRVRQNTKGSTLGYSNPDE